MNEDRIISPLLPVEKKSYLKVVNIICDHSAGEESYICDEVCRPRICVFSSILENNFSGHTICVHVFCVHSISVLGSIIVLVPFFIIANVFVSISNNEEFDIFIFNLGSFSRNYLEDLKNNDAYLSNLRKIM